MTDQTGLLFELRSEEDIRKDAIHLNRQRIHEVIKGDGPWKLSIRQYRLLDVLRNHQGRDQAIGIAELEQKLKMSPREIKAEVRELVVTFELCIVASRDGETGGYFFATTAGERVKYSQDYVKEAVKLLRRAAIIRNVSDLNALLGQAQLEMKEGA